MDNLTLREATSSDYESIVSLMQQLNPDDPILEKSTGQDILNTILESEGLTIFIADIGSETVATCYLNVIPNMTRGGQYYALIENVVTDKAHQRKGIGVRLLKHVIATAFDQGCYKVMLLTGRDTQVHSFYENCGLEKNSKTAFVRKR